MTDEHIKILKSFRDPLVGLPVSHLWRGAGSAIFLEFGLLRERKRLDGTSGNSAGEFTLMIEWSWRIEDTTSILCGSWSDESLWQPNFDLIRNKTVLGLTLFGRLPEIAVALSENLHVSSFMTADGGPVWALRDRREATTRSLRVEQGCLKLSFQSPNN